MIYILANSNCLTLKKKRHEKGIVINFCKDSNFYIEFSCYNCSDSVTVLDPTANRNRKKYLQNINILVQLENLK